MRAVPALCGQEEIAAVAESGGRAGITAEREKHARSCEICGRVIALHQELNSQLSRMAGGPRRANERGCPPPEEWASLAAGLLTTERREAMLDHAADCDGCGALLHGVVADFSAEKDFPEAKELAALATRTPERQREIARRMTRIAGGGGERPEYWRWAAVAAAVVLSIGLGWFGYDRWKAGDPSLLIAQAYTERRPYDFRVAGANHAPIRSQRRAAGSPFERPRALMKAESLVAERLAANPDSPEWLALRARAELLAWDAEAAIATVTRALERQPGNAELLADLGMAYALRADAEDRRPDYGRAIEHLSQALQAKPDMAVSVFNRAIVYERMQLYEEAIAEWRRYLGLDPAGGWAEEARRHLRDLEQKKKLDARP